MGPKMQPVTWGPCTRTSPGPNHKHLSVLKVIQAVPFEPDRGSTDKSGYPSIVWSGPGQIEFVHGSEKAVSPEVDMTVGLGPHIPQDTAVTCWSS